MISNFGKGFSACFHITLSLKTSAPQERSVTNFQNMWKRARTNFSRALVALSLGCREIGVRPRANTLKELAQLARSVCASVKQTPRSNVLFHELPTTVLPCSIAQEPLRHTWRKQTHQVSSTPTRHRWPRSLCDVALPVDCLHLSSMQASCGHCIAARRHHNLS